MNDSFLLSLQGPVAHLQLNRPDRANALSAAFFVALREAVRGLCEGGAVRALVISSTGAQFSAGLAAESSGAPAGAPPADRRNPNASAARQAVGALLQMLDDDAAAPGAVAAPPPVQRLLDGLHALGDAPFPVICAVQGACAGAALALAGACDIRLCSADASFTPHGGGPGGEADPAVLRAVARLLPAGTLREMAFTGEPLAARRAHELGFVNAVWPDAAALMQHALALAAHIAARAPLAMSAAKLALRLDEAGEWPAPAAIQRP